jgi:hypothetical protein
MGDSQHPHDTNWSWLSPMIQISAACLPWYRLVLIVSHYIDRRWCSPMIHISDDVLPWYRLVLMFSHDTCIMGNISADLHHARQSALICFMGDSQHQSLSWENISTNLYHGRTLTPISMIQINADCLTWYRLVLIFSHNTY